MTASWPLQSGGRERSCPDQSTVYWLMIMPVSTGFSGAESGRIRIGDTVVVFAQGPIGLCATAGARLMGATSIIAVESVPAGDLKV